MFQYVYVTVHKTLALILTNTNVTKWTKSYSHTLLPGGSVDIIIAVKVELNIE